MLNKKKLGGGVGVFWHLPLWVSEHLVPALSYRLAEGFQFWHIEVVLGDRSVFMFGLQQVDKGFLCFCWKGLITGVIAESSANNASCWKGHAHQACLSSGIRRTCVYCSLRSVYSSFPLLPLQICVTKMSTRNFQGMDSVIKPLDTIPEDKKVRVQRTQSSFDPFEKAANQVKRVHSENNACINFKSTSVGKESPKVRRHSSPSSVRMLHRVGSLVGSGLPSQTSTPPVFVKQLL